MDLKLQLEEEHLLTQKTERNSPEEAESGLPTEQMSPMKEIENNARPTAGEGLAVGSFRKCTQQEVNNDLGAGANAGSRADIMFVTTNSLSELVWSPNSGLSLKCADCSLTENKTFLWGTESTNMVPSPPLSIAVRETNDDRHGANGNLNSSQVVCCLDGHGSDRIILAQSPSISKEIMPIYKTMNHQIGSCGEMKELRTALGKPVTEIDQGDDHMIKKGKGICSPTDISWIRRNNTSNLTVNAFIPVHDNGINMELPRERLREGTSYVLVDGNKDIGSGNSHTAATNAVLASEDSITKELILPEGLPILTSPNSKHEVASVVKEDGEKKLPTVSSNTYTEKRGCTSEKNIQQLKGKSACIKVGTASSRVDEVKQKSVEILPRIEVAAAEGSPNNSRICLYQRYSKEKVLSNAGENEGTLKAEDDSRGSAESCNKTRLCLAGKRPWSSEQLDIENKKRKKQSHENPHCASVQRYDSSFMNWILNMVKGLTKSETDGAPSLNLIVRPQHEHGSHDQQLIFHGKTQQSGCTNMGFGTIFKALYCPGSNEKDSEMLKLDHRSEGSRELDLAYKIRDNSSSPPGIGEENYELYKGTTSSSKNHVMSGDGEGPLNVQSFPYTNINVSLEDHKKASIPEKSISFNIACGPGKHGVSSSNSTFRNDFDSSPQEQEACKLSFIHSNKSLNSLTDRSHPPESLWITRFSPKVCRVMINSSQCNQNVGASVENSTENFLSFVKGQNVAESCRESNAEDQADVANKKMSNSITNGGGSFGSVRMKEHTEKKFKSKLNPIHPSQRFETSEAMASVFARRLDALRQVMPVEVSGSAIHATATCFFCGITGHKLQDCSEVTESELEDLLKQINSYDGAEKLSCFCIRCFHLNHWANQCPNISSRKRSHSDGNIPSVDLRTSGKMVQIHRDDILSNNEKTAPERSGLGYPVALTVCDRKMCMVDNKFTTGISAYNDSAMMLTKKDLVDNEFREGKSGKITSTEFKQNEKQSKTSSSNEESKDVQISAFCNFVNRQIPAVPRETFEAIKRLRLSRTDIIKWMNSSMSPFCLEGCYLRLRLRKWGEGQGGTGYYVARINGVLREKSSCSSKIPLSVNIGSFKCFVENRFVSNQDFLEDELMAWWCSTLKYGGNLPSEQDIKMKLEERKSFGF